MRNTFNIMAFLLISLLLGACNSSEKQKAMSQTSTAVADNTSVDYQVGDHLPNELVCMVNDAYMGKPQIPVPVNGKTYYGCCQMCVGKLNEQESARVATDAFSRNKVDKSEAYIVLLNQDGAVGYFESAQNYQKFSKEMDKKRSSHLTN